MVNWGQGLKFRRARFLVGKSEGMAGGGGDNADTIWAPGDMFRWPHSYFFPISPTFSLSPSFLFSDRLETMGREKRRKMLVLLLRSRRKIFFWNYEDWGGGGYELVFISSPGYPSSPTARLLTAVCPLCITCCMLSDCRGGGHRPNITEHMSLVRRVA